MKLKDGFFLVPENVDDIKSTYPISIPEFHIQNAYFEMDEDDLNFLRETAKAFGSKEWKNYELISIESANASGKNPVFSWFIHQVNFLTHRMRKDKRYALENLLMGYVLDNVRTFVKMLELKSILDSAPETKSKILNTWNQEEILHLSWESTSAEEVLNCLINPENLWNQPQQNRS